MSLRQGAVVQAGSEATAPGMPSHVRLQINGVISPATPSQRGEFYHSSRTGFHHQCRPEYQWSDGSQVCQQRTLNV